MVYYIPIPYFHARSLIEKKLKHARYQKIDSLSFNNEMVEKLLQSQGLFGDHVIVFSDVLTKDQLSFFRLLVTNTTHTVFFVESEDFKWKQDFIQAVGGHIVDTGKSAKISSEFKTSKSYAFDVGAKILDKDKKNAWLAYQKALLNDEAPEAIHSAVWWTIKQLVPIHPMPRFAKYKKSYGFQEVSKLSLWWVSILHNARKQNTELSLAIEKAILEM